MKTVHLSLFVVIILLIQACGSSSEVIVVRDSPRTGVADTTESTEDGDDTFNSLSIGLIESVNNFDPLYAEDLSTMRVLSSIYESLYSISPENEVQNQLASRTSVSSDSLTYTITLREGVFYHDKDVFNAGIGRRLHARDIKWVFERTAFNDVPPMAAGLLMNIQGFRSFYLEQRRVYDPELRVLDGVTGIKVLDARTLSITLREKDPDFTRKLASPLLSIYPYEAVRRSDSSLAKDPVGTGTFSHQSSDSSRIVLVLTDPETHSAELVDRIDFIHGMTEGQLFQEFARNQIDWIPEIGPRIRSQIMDGDALMDTYAGEYMLTEQSSSRLTTLHMNSESDFDLTALSNRLASFADHRFSLQGESTFNELALIVSEPDSGAVPADSSRYLVVHTDNPFARALYSEINREWMNPDAALAFLNIRVPIPEAALYSGLLDSFHEPFLSDLQATPWLTFETQIYGIAHDDITIPDLPATPWGLNLDSPGLQTVD
ncbi:MAG: ABC transporter substrate-binding protein [Balneolaceae bacterium]|nr:ABC transporter substrate-binding protein [Balneolaceae bacterium]